MTNEDLSKLTVPALRKLATERNIKGRSTMARPALIEALTALQAQDERAAIVDSFIATSVDPSAMDRIDALPDVSGTITGRLIEDGPIVSDGTPVRRLESPDELAKTIGRMMATFATRATARYIRDGRKHLTPRQRRRVNHKTNAYMKRAAADA